MPPSVHDQLAPVALERARVLAPCVLFGVSSTLVSSESVGIPLSVPVVTYNVIAIAVLVLLTVQLHRRRVPELWGHGVLALVWALPVGGTLLSQYFSGSELLTSVLLVEVASTAIMLHTRWVLGLLLALNVIWVPLALRDYGGQAVAQIANVGLGELFAIVLHMLMWRSLVRAESHREAEARTAQALAHQLAELQRSEQQRAELQHQLVHSQRMEVAGTLAAGLAHDMNNVLASITSLAELIADEPPAAARADLEQILAQTARGAELTRGLLAFSRRGQYRKQVLLFDDVLEDVLPLLVRTLPKSVELVTELDAAAACVDADPTQLAQVLVNLGINASDAMDGKGTLRISSEIVDLGELTARSLDVPAGRYVRLQVSDTGPGIDEATQLRVFEPFFTTKPHGKGTGLGLSIVWGVVRHHGGAVMVEPPSAPTTPGATFCVHLPITLAPRTARPVPRPISDPGHARSTILVIDDEPAVRRATARLLERHGYDVLLASDGAQGVRLYEEEAAVIALVILDMGMPVMGGAECFARLRRLGDVPVLVATGYAVEADAQALVARGATLLEKPFRSTELLAEVTRMLDERTKTGQRKNEEGPKRWRGR